MDSDDEFHEYEPDPSKIATHWEKSSKSKNDKGVLSSEFDADPRATQSGHVFDRN